MKRLAVAVLFGVLAGCSGSDEQTPAPVDSTSVDVTSDDTLTLDTGTGDTTVDSAIEDSTPPDTASAEDTLDAADGGLDAADSGLDAVDAVDANDTAVDTLAPDTAVDTLAPDTADTTADDTFVPDTTVTDAADSAVSDVADSSDAGTAPVLPGATCVGTLTDSALVNLYAMKPVTGTPTFILGGSTTARRLGSYTSSLYSRSCASTTGCTAWASASQPAYETFYSINSGVRDGAVHLWSPSSGSHRIGIVSNTIGTDCRGWTQGIGTMVRTGDSASVTLATSVEDNCTAGADPVFYFQEIDLYDPTGIVTDHCMKLTYSKQRNRVDIGPGAFTYDEYMVVYDATY